VSEVAQRSVQALGGVLVLAVLQDVFSTVLFPASGHGLLRRPLSRWTWRAFRVAARRLAPPRRRRLLASSGPVLVTVGLGAWILLLVVGWACVYWPALGTAVTASVLSVLVGVAFGVHRATRGPVRASALGLAGAALGLALLVTGTVTLDTSPVVREEHRREARVQQADSRGARDARLEQAHRR
jgi:hypothetical protein